MNDLWRTIPTKKSVDDDSKKILFPEEPQENILYFIEKNAPLLEPWQREIVRIVRKIAQYFYPQGQTKVMNEGWASFWHYTLLNQLYDEGLVTDELMLEVLQNHTNVIYQVPFDNPHYSGINPYTLGFHMMQDIRRMAESPTEEDTIWFPHLVNTNWITTLDFAMRNFKDESFIAQYLSPKLIRDLKLFSILDDDTQPDYVVSAIHDEHGYQHVRTVLSRQYDLGYIEPNIQVVKVDVQGNRALYLQHQQQDRRPLLDKSEEVMRHVYRLWGFPVHLDSVDPSGQTTAQYQCPLK